MAANPTMFGARYPDPADRQRAEWRCLESLVSALMTVEQEIASAEREILVWHRSNEASRRLASIPGIGPITANALAASVPDPTIFKSGRALAAWIG